MGRTVGIGVNGMVGAGVGAGVSSGVVGNGVGAEVTEHPHTMVNRGPIPQRSGETNPRSPASSNSRQVKGSSCSVTMSASGTDTLKNWFPQTGQTGKPGLGGRGEVVPTGDPSTTVGAGVRRPMTGAMVGDPGVPAGAGVTKLKMGGKLGGLAGAHPHGTDTKKATTSQVSMSTKPRSPEVWYSPHVMESMSGIMVRTTSGLVTRSPLSPQTLQAVSWRGRACRNWSNMGGEVDTGACVSCFFAFFRARSSARSTLSALSSCSGCSLRPPRVLAAFVTNGNSSSRRSNSHCVAMGLISLMVDGICVPIRCGRRKSPCVCEIPKKVSLN